MLEGQVAYFLQKYLGNYVAGIDADSLRVSVLRGDVSLSNLTLKAGALDGLGLPLTVKGGLLGRLSLRVPWANLRGSPVVVEVDRLYVLAGPSSGDDEDEEEEDGDDGEGAGDDDGSKTTHADDRVGVGVGVGDDDGAINNRPPKQRRRRRPPPTEADADAAIAAAAAADLALRRRVVAEAELAWAAGKFGGLDAVAADAASAASASTSTASASTSSPLDASNPEEDQQAGLLRGLADVILGNLQISISQVHIRYEDPGGGRGREARRGRGGDNSPPLAAGVTLAGLVARTVDASGSPSFVTHDPLSLLRKSSELRRLSLYFDAGAQPWRPPRGRRRWADVPPAGWDVLFADGVSGPPPSSSSSSNSAAAAPRPIGLAVAAPALPSPAAGRAYVLRPVDGRATYVRAGPTARKKRRLEREKRRKAAQEEAKRGSGGGVGAGGDEDAELPFQSVDASLDAVSLHLSRAQYLGAQSILEAVDAHAARAPHAHLRPPAATVGRPGPWARDPATGKNAAARAWWVYAARAVCKRLSKQRGTGGGVGGPAE